MITAVARILDTASGIDAGYTHFSKHVAHGEPLELAGTLLKWYEVHPVDRPVPDGIRALARTYLMSATLDAQGMGFVILHRCGEAFYFLIVCTKLFNSQHAQIRHPPGLESAPAPR